MKKQILIVLGIVCANVMFSQNTLPKDTFIFTTVKENKITSIKNQANTGTCWSFSTIAFFESELLRIGKPETDLSEMFVVHHSYTDKADKYVRTNGTINFAQGGSAFDVLYVLKNYGIVPEKDMPGLNYGTDKHNHGELEALTTGVVKSIVQNPNKTISTAWKPAFESILDAYLGKLPAEITANGRKYTPLAYEQSLGLNLDDYVSITSFIHHPFYTKFALEIPDNWRWSDSYNLPMNEMLMVVDHAINAGYTVAWGADTSEKGFTRNGLALMPESKKESLIGTDQAKWMEIQKNEKKYYIKAPVQEITVTQEMRQQAFDNYQTTDDHGMQIYGIAKDQNGTEYYMVKNSWGTDNKYQGTWYVSKPYVLYKTTSILVNKNSIPKEILKKLGI